MKDFLKESVHKFNTSLLCILLKLKSEFYDPDHFKRVLIIAPHPDDEVLGLGGQIQRFIRTGSKVTLIFLTDGEGSDTWNDKEEIRQNRITLSLKVASILGVSTSNIYRLHLKDGSVPHSGQPGFEEVVERVREIIVSVNADVVFATHTLDYWPFDHVACGQIAHEAIVRSEIKSQLWYYWVWAWYNIKPGQLMKIKFGKLRKINIREQMAEKKVLMDMYLKAVTPYGKPWSGVLPQALLNAIEYPFEITERII